MVIGEPVEVDQLNSDNKGQKGSGHETADDALNGGGSGSGSQELLGADKKKRRKKKLE